VTPSYQERVRQTLLDLKVPDELVTRYARILQPEGQDLVSIGLDMFQREQRLERSAAAQWQAMVAAAAQELVVLSAISGFRSFDYQRGIIERKLREGITLHEILTASALPGYSEHHTGRAIDIGTPGSKPLEEEFEKTLAFDWLTRRAGEFGFTMTYPRGNSHGIIYEPWHWCHASKS
jgi:D-alanyl-D-alanine carboxypeptidase